MLARLVASAVALGAAAATSDCSSCVERGDSVVKVITHGVWSNTFWTLFRAAAVQAAADPGVALDMELRETWDSDVMAAEIDSLARTCLGKCVAVVTLPDAAARAAVARATAAGVVVYGVNSGYPGAGLGLSGFVGANETEAGLAAAAAA